MLEVVAYKRLKTIENDKTISPPKRSRSHTGGAGRLLEVPTVRLWENFGVLDRWSLMGGGRLREAVARGGSTECQSIDRALYELNVKI